MSKIEIVNASFDYDMPNLCFRDRVLAYLDAHESELEELYNDECEAVEPEALPNELNFN